MKRPEVYVSVILMPDGRLLVGGPVHGEEFSDQVARLIAAANAICRKLEVALPKLLGPEFERLHGAVLSMLSACEVLAEVAECEAQLQRMADAGLLRKVTQ